MKRRRVLQVLGALERGGVESWLLDLNRRLADAGWQFDFCALGPAPGRYASAAAAAGARTWLCPAGQAGFPRRFYDLLRREGYQLVHSHVHHFSAVVLAAARAARVPVRVAHSHNTADGRPDDWRRRLYRAAARRVLGRVLTHGLACSSEAAAALFGTGWRRDRRVTVLPYGVPLAEAAAGRAEVRRRLGIAAHATVVLHVGRLERQKNPAWLLEVARAFAAARPEALWLLAGEGRLRGWVEQRKRELGLQSRVRLLGLREDVPALLAASDAFLLPSLHEGLPLALLEAQAAGRRAVVSDRVTAEAAVVPGAVEFVPLEASAGVWAERLRAALEAGPLAPEAAAGALQAAGLSSQQSLQRLLKFYEEAQEGARG